MKLQQSAPYDRSTALSNDPADNESAVRPKPADLTTENGLSVRPQNHDPSQRPRFESIRQRLGADEVALNVFRQLDAGNLLNLSCVSLADRDMVFDTPDLKIVVTTAKDKARDIERAHIDNLVDGHRSVDDFRAALPFLSKAKLQYVQNGILLALQTKLERSQATRVSGLVGAFMGSPRLKPQSAKNFANALGKAKFRDKPDNMTDEKSRLMSVAFASVDSTDAHAYDALVAQLDIPVISSVLRRKTWMEIKPYKRADKASFDRLPSSVREQIAKPRPSKDEVV